MASQQAIDFLEKEITINKNVVTFRSLSRQLTIHVNTAKNELASYHAQARRDSEHVYATYLVSGEVFNAPTDFVTQSQDEAMDIDFTEDFDDSEDVPKTKMVLVGERDLEATKSTFRKLHSCHIYCLSPSNPRDAGFICASSEHVRKADSKKGTDFAAIVGKVVSSQVKFSVKAIKGKGNASKASSSMPTPGPSLKPKIDEKTLVKPSPPENEKPKAAGTLDWSKAKAKEPKKDTVRVKQEKKDTVQEKSESSMSTKGKGDKNDQTRGTKRKSNVMTQSDAEGDSSRTPSPVSKITPGPSSKPPSAKGARVKKGVVMSDDDDDDDDRKQDKRRHAAKGKTKARVEESEAERSLREMMDIDDDDVMKASRPINQYHKEEEESEEDAMVEDKGEDVMDEDSDPAPKAKPRKRKEKKVIPVGRNGLKKKRVMKSRMMTDAKGYMVTEDYSSYESVEEEEEEVEPAKPKGKKPPAQKKANPKKAEVGPENSDSRPSPKAAPEETKAVDKKPLKRTASGMSSTKSTNGAKLRPAGSSNNLMNYFGGKPKK